MSVQQATIKKNGEALLEGIRVWVNWSEGPGGEPSCWGYMNPGWEDPIGSLDPEGGQGAQYELALAGGETYPIRVWDHRDEHFVQANQGGYRTVRFESVE